MCACVCAVLELSAPTEWIAMRKSLYSFCLFFCYYSKKSIIDFVDDFIMFYVDFFTFIYPVFCCFLNISATNMI